MLRKLQSRTEEIRVPLEIRPSEIPLLVLPSLEENDMRFNASVSKDVNFGTVRAAIEAAGATITQTLPRIRVISFEAEQDMANAIRHLEGVVFEEDGIVKATE